MSSPRRPAGSKAPKKTNKQYEMKFASLEVILAVGDLEAEELNKKFFVGRLQEDVLMGTDSEAQVQVSWYDDIGKDQWEIGDDDELPVGSLVCSITSFVTAVTGSDNLEILTVPTEAFAYGDTKLSQQLQDDYDSDDDSQFGDDAVMKRVGQTGKSTNSKKAKQEDGDINMEDADDDDDEEGGGRKKKRKRSSGGGTKKKTKVTKGLTPRPDFKSVADPLLVKKGKIEDFDGDVERTTKEMIRAIHSNDVKALKAAIKSPKVGHLTYPHSVGFAVTPLICAITEGNTNMYKILCDYFADANNKPARATFQSCALPTLTTGKQTSRHANYNRRKINASRGGREGNNALLYDARGSEYKFGLASGPYTFLPIETPNFHSTITTWNVLLDFDSIEPLILETAEAKYSQEFRDHRTIDFMVQGGHLHMTRDFVEKRSKHAHDSNAYNFLHLEALGDEPTDPSKPFSKDFQARSVIKKAGDGNTRLTPLMFACINPETAYLEALLKVAPEHAQSVDAREAGLLHYAAACEGSGPLEYLIKTHSLSRTTVNKDKMTPLHFAARAARPENIKALLKGVEPDQLKSLLNAKSTDGFAPIHYAARTRRATRLKTAKALLDGGADPNSASGASRNKVSPMHIAASVGHLDVLELLVSRGGNPLKGDKLGRSPLIHASLNGHAHVVAYLLKIGVQVEACDTSDNRAVHYAAAYGWDDCLDLLLEAGADPDAKNSWKTSPLSVAVQKGRHRVSAKLLKLPNVDVNFKDDEGKTLFLRLLEGFIAKTLLSSDAAPFVPVAKGTKKRKNTKAKGPASEADAEIAAIKSELPQSLQKLLERKDVDMSTTDENGCTFLHTLCMQTYEKGTHGEKRAIAITKLVLSIGKIDLDSPDSEGVPAVFHAATCGNAGLFEFLLDQGATISTDTVDKEGKNICHHLLAQPHTSKKQLELVEKAVGEEVFKSLLLAQDVNGLASMHHAMLHMVNNLQVNRHYDEAHSCVKSIASKFPELVPLKVGPTNVFRDPKKLALLIVGDNEDEDEDEQESSNSHHYSWRQRNQSSNNGPTFLLESDRVDGKKLRKALKKRDHVVPTESEHTGKALIHILCGSTFPHRIEEALEWIVPLSGDVLSDEAGRGKTIRTPLQTLLFDVLPKGLTHRKPSSNWQTDQDHCLKILIDVVQRLAAAGAGDVNGNISSFFGDDAKYREFRDGEKRELSEEADTAAAKSLERCARAFLENDNGQDGKEVLRLFSTMMIARERRVLSQNDSLSYPLAHVLSRAGSARIPIKVWRRLVDECGLDLCTIDSHKGRSALHIALTARDESLCRFLCQKAPQLTTKPSNDGERPIHVVAKVDNAKFVKMLLEHLPNKKQEVNEGDSQNRTAFHFSVEKAASRKGEELEPCEILLLRAGARLDVADERQRTPLHYCLLEKASSDDHFNFPHSLTARIEDRVELVSSLLSAEGASACVKMADKYGRTPLSYAAAYGSTVSSLLLVSKGADMFHKDQDGNTPINVAVLRGHDTYTITMLKSVGTGNLPKLEDVIDIRREEVKTDDGGTKIRVSSRTKHSIVWHAIKSNFRGLVYILLDTSFPLHVAAVDALSNGSFQLVRKLISTSSLDVVQHVDPGTGRTLLHEVARVQQFGNKEWSTTLANLLLSSDVPASAKAHDGQTALHIAAANGHEELVALLVRKDHTTVKMSDNDGHLPLGRFMRALPSLHMNEICCNRMIRHLTSGFGKLSDPVVNRVPRTRKDARTIRYEGISFSAGPNRDTVTKELEKELAKETGGKVHPENRENDQVEGYSTLIIQAILAGKLELMQSLVEQGALIDMQDSSGLAPLHHAVLSVSLPSVALLLRNKADVDVVSLDKRAVTPLITACFKCAGASGSVARETLKVVKMLLRFGADVLPACKQTGNTALHVACQENNFDLADLLLRAALHAGSSEKAASAVKPQSNTKALVRFGPDTALYPASVSTRYVTVDDPSHATLPIASVSGIYEHSGLSLDSLEALVQLARKKLDTESMSTHDVAAQPSGNDEEENHFEEEAGEDDDDEEDDDEEDDDDDGDEELDNGEEPVVQDNKPPILDIDSTKFEQGAKRKLLQFFGQENLVVQQDDANLTARLQPGTLVIVQPTKAKRTYANGKTGWFEGRVIRRHNNETYDVDLLRGPSMVGVLRQQMRPWTQRKGGWPESFDKRSPTLKALVGIKNSNGLTPLEIVAKPSEFGSYENSDLARLLFTCGSKGGKGLVALGRPGSQFRKYLGSLVGTAEESSGDESQNPAMQIDSPRLAPISAEQFALDTKAALVAQEEKGVLKRKDSSPSINKVCEMQGRGLRVLPMLNSQDPAHYYDVVMTKVEMSHYGYSENKYYKMQIVENQTKGLCVLVTNWGQVGDYGGQKQETPFGSRDEASMEFCKVFKSKTGNKWEDYASSNFTPMLGKYKPVHLLAKGFEKPELPNIPKMLEDVEENQDVVRDTALSPELVETMTEFVNPKAIAAAASRLGLQQEQCPLGRLSIATILAAEDKLKDVEEALKVADRLTKPEELQEKRGALEKVAILSSEYFELLPTKEGDNALAPLEKDSARQQKAIILGLKELTAASQIVTTASHKATEVNPLDYAYRVLNASLTVVPHDTPERVGVEQYFRNTAPNEDLVINQVFELKRGDETSNAKLSNHRLLWHGTPVANMLGVIKEGLRVAPPTAAISGNAFGDGVYFADMASKSFAYCRANLVGDSKKMPRAYMLLADVALGKQEVVSDSSWGAEDIVGDSILAVGYEGPDVTKDIVFRSSGTAFPLGEVVRSPTFEPKVFWRRSYHESIHANASEAIEKALKSPETKYPARVAIMYGDKNADAVLEHGPLSKTAKIEPPQTKKRKKSGKGGKKTKKRRRNDDQAVDAGGDEAADDNEDDPPFQAFVVNRNEEPISNHVHYNEYVVNDTARVNLRYIVELTSRSWLKNQMKKAKRGAT